MNSSDKNKCPNCDSTNQTLSVGFDEDVKAQIHDNVRIKAKDDTFTGKKKLRQDIFSGDDQRKRDGKWMKKQRVIDKDNDYYKEVVIDPETDKVIHECEEKLSEHFGHGSAKNK
jgi:phage FluMu protein Com